MRAAVSLVPPLHAARALSLLEASVTSKPCPISCIITRQMRFLRGGGNGEVWEIERPISELLGRRSVASPSAPTPASAFLLYVCRNET